MLKRLARRTAVPLSAVLTRARLYPLTHTIRKYWDRLEGKGISTWDIGAESKAARRVIENPRPVIFDLGANEGNWTAAMQEYFPNGQYYLFEPQPTCAAHILARGLPNTQVFEQAVSSRTGVTTLYVSVSSDIGSLYQRRDYQHETYTPIRVSTNTIDAIMEQFGLAQIDFIKMDIEGHELDALKGAVKGLSEKRIQVFSFEFGSSNINSRTYFYDYWDFITPYDYHIYRILPGGRLLPILKYSEECEHFSMASNYLAVLLSQPNPTPRDSRVSPNFKRAR
jgi:FkbM family methyltransferase